ncbi:MAG: adenylate/guanylate cyclase domain-containing protein [Saprospiraceae bacterium]|nr:adenylate/guanylate cyclase domain-containing protein [Saprospiraceae bacterium]
MNKTRTTIGIILMWLIVATVQSIYESALLSNYGVSAERINFWVLLSTSQLVAIIAGFFMGYFFFPKANIWLRTLPYGKTLWLIFLTFSGFYLVVGTMGSFIYNSLTYGFGSQDSWVKAIEHLTSSENLKNYMFWLIVTLLTTLLLQVNDKYGPGNFQAFLLGKYFKPTRVDRIFMFLDLRSSTTIAEKLGELQYFSFIRRFFQDVTPALLENKGEIYQYVGDEIVVSWKLEQGLHQQNCLQSFFDAKAKLESLADTYQENFGVVPSFKVGLHYGSVIVGEIGLVKRDIAFSGDVLNTTARIQSKCNEFGVDILISNQLLEAVQQESQGKFQFQSIGEVELRGKAKPLQLFTVQNNA